MDLAPVAKTSLLHVAGRMMRSFTADISASSDIQWTQVGSLFGAIDMRVRVKSSVQEFGRTQGSTVIFTTSVWLPASPKQLFNFLSDHEFRFKVCKYIGQVNSRKIEHWFIFLILLLQNGRIME